MRPGPDVERALATTRRLCWCFSGSGGGSVSQPVLQFLEEIRDGIGQPSCSLTAVAPEGYVRLCTGSRTFPVQRSPSRLRSSHERERALWHRRRSSGCDQPRSTRSLRHPNASSTRRQSRGGGGSGALVPRVRPQHHPCPPAPSPLLFAPVPALPDRGRAVATSAAHGRAGRPVPALDATDTTRNTPKQENENA